MKRVAIICLGLFALSGCSSMHQQPIVEEQQTIILQQDLIRPCQSLKPLQDKEYTQAESFEAIKQWALQYKECQIKHKALADILQNLNK